MGKNSTKLILIPFILILIVIAWFFGLYMPMNAQADKVSKQIQKIEVKAREIVPQAKVDMLQTNVDTLILQLKQRNNQLYPEEALLQIGKVFRQLGDSAGIKLVNITPDYQVLTQMATTSDEIVELPVTCEFEGNFANLTKFVDEASRFPFYYEIQYFTIKHHEEDDTKLVILLKGEIIIQKQKKSKMRDKDLS